MKIVQGGVVTGLAIGAWTFVMGLTGWYKDPTLLALFWVVVPLQIAGLVWTLMRTKHEGRGWGGQVLAGFLTSAIAAGFAFAASLLFTKVAFPQYFDELSAIHEQMLRDRGLSDAEVRRTIAEAAGTQTSTMQATLGMMGTLITGLFVSMGIAIFVRTKDDAPAASPSTSASGSG